jgi:hypothetical protein
MTSRSRGKAWKAYLILSKTKYGIFTILPIFRLWLLCVGEQSSIVYLRER